MASIRAINWPATVASVQAALDGMTYGALSQAELVTGVTIREAVKTAGATYDAQSTDGIGNASAYALSVQAWAIAAQPAWVELDRVNRAVYELLPPPNVIGRAAFGTSGVPTWQPNTLYKLGDPITGAILPDPANGLAYVCLGNGQSGATAPSWSTTIGDTFFDGDTSWECVGPTTSSSTPIALPWDITLQTKPTLNARTSAASAMTAVSAGLSNVQGLALLAWNTALSAKPAANPIQDSASLTANNALTAAIANATQWLAAAAIR